MTNWDLFFPHGTRVLALPSWRNPRLYLPAQYRLQRWEASSFYPAFRFRARLYRSLLRIKATTGLGETRTSRSGGWPLGDFVQDALPGAVSAVVLAGTPNPAQKITAQLQDKEGRVLGYLKYAEKEAARRRLQQEYLIIANLPEKVGPELLKYGVLGDGEALLTSLLPGQQLPATLPPDSDLASLLMLLVVLPPVPLADHPWVQRIRERNEIEFLDLWLDALVDKDWPVVVQHGDFTPWNLLRRPGGTMGAIDWEYGSLEGFPYLDLAHYILQTAALVYRWAPSRAAEYAIEYLTREPPFALSSVEARALTCLAAYEAYLKYQEDGHPFDGSSGAYLQKWRRTIWEGSACAG